MRLVLDVTSFQKALMGSGSRHVFDESGGVIGRGRRSDWVLPDPDRYVSSAHAEVSFDGERFYITDASTNGLFLNESSVPLGKGGRWPLSDGDRMALGDFVIVAHIEEDAAGAAVVPPPAVDIDSLLGPAPEPAATPAPAAPSREPEQPPSAPPTAAPPPMPAAESEPASEPPLAGPTVPPPPPRLAPKPGPAFDERPIAEPPTAPPVAPAPPPAVTPEPAQQPAPPPGLADTAPAKADVPPTTQRAAPPPIDDGPPERIEPESAPSEAPAETVGPKTEKAEEDLPDAPISAPVPADHAAAIADLDLDDLLGPAAPETAGKPSKEAAPASGSFPPPPTLSKPPTAGPSPAPRPQPAMPAAMPDDIDDLLGGPIDVPPPPTEEVPAALPETPPVAARAEREVSPIDRLSPDRIVDAAGLPADLSETERKARLWDEFTRVYSDLQGKEGVPEATTGGRAL